MAAAGASVLVNDIGTSVKGEGSDAGPAQKVADEINNRFASRGARAVANTDSVAQWESANRIIANALDVFGRIDVVVNNAGILRDRFFFNMSVEEWRAVIDVHLNGSFYVARPPPAVFQVAGVGVLHPYDLDLRARRQSRPGELLGSQARHRGIVQVDRARHGEIPRALELHLAFRLEPHDRLDSGRDGGPEGPGREAEGDGDF